MQHVPAPGSQRVVAQQLVTGRAPDIRRHAEALPQDFLGPQRLANDRAAAQEVGLQRFLFRATSEPVKPFQDSLRHPLLGHGRHLVVLVVKREVVEHVLALGIHAPQAVSDDHRQLVGERRVVSQQRRDCARQNQAVAVLMLKALTVERGAPRGGTAQKALRPHIARQPHQVANALEAEHRVIDIEGDHLHAMRRIGSARRHERSHRARLRNALFEDLAVFLLVVVEQRFAVHRLVKLPLGRVNADLAE